MKLSEYLEGFKDSIKDFDNFCLNFITKQSEMINNQAKKRTPVDTGNLRNAWAVTKVEKDGKEFKAEINNSMNYADYVEYGTRKMEARNMITEPLNQYRSNVNARVEKSLKTYLKKKGIGE